MSSPNFTYSGTSEGAKEALKSWMQPDDTYAATTHPDGTVVIQVMSHGEPLDMVAQLHPGVA